MDNLTRPALAREWRPQAFGQVIAQPHVVQALTNALTHNRLHHAYLFTGTRGVGKTTIARILAKCLNCVDEIAATPCNQCVHCEEVNNGSFPDLYEIDAASRTKVEDTREILNNIQYAPTKGRFKIYLIDEVHMLSGHSFNALLKTLEEPPEHVKFLLATTDPQKLPATVLSRCLQFHLTPMQPAEIQAHLRTVLDAENVTCDDEALSLLAEAARGSMRDALSLLDQAIAFSNQQVKHDIVKAMLGTVDRTVLKSLLQALAAQDSEQVMQLCQQLALNGTNFQQALNDLLSLLYQLTLQQILPTSGHALSELAKALSTEQTQLFYQIGLLGQRDLNLAPTPQIGFEMTVLRMLTFTPEAPVSLTPGAAATAASPATAVSAAVSSPSVVNATVNSPTTTNATTVPKSSAAPKSSAVPVPADDTSWPTLVNQLGLTGATKAIAAACVREQFNNNALTLKLDQQHAALLNDNHVQRIGMAMSALFQRTITCEIDIGTTADQATPSAEQPIEDPAKANLLKEPGVKQIIKTFDATLVESSVKAIADHAN